VPRVTWSRARAGGVQGQSFVGLERHRFEDELKVTDDGMVELLDRGAVQAHVVGGPASAELVAPGGQLADEVLERA
jgi:hypothetical protein